MGECRDGADKAGPWLDTGRNYYCNNSSMSRVGVARARSCGQKMVGDNDCQLRSVSCKTAFAAIAALSVALLWTQ